MALPDSIKRSRTLHVGLAVLVLAPGLLLFSILIARFTRNWDLAVALAAYFPGSIVVYVTAMIVFQFINAFTEDPVEFKVLWAAGLFLCFPVVGLVFWYFRIWSNSNAPRIESHELATANNGGAPGPGTRRRYSILIPYWVCPGR